MSCGDDAHLQTLNTKRTTQSKVFESTAGIQVVVQAKGPVDVLEKPKKLRNLAAYQTHQQKPVAELKETRSVSELKRHRLPLAYYVQQK